MKPGRRNRTQEAVIAHLDAFGCDRFEVGVFDREEELMMNMDLTREEILNRLPWLCRRNAEGCEVYVRPHPEDPQNGLVLVDDLEETAGAEMVRRGWRPSAVLETSPGSFQAWIRVGSFVEPEVRLSIARRMARELDGDPGAVGARQYGRLAGFTNRKPKHAREDGLGPFVRLHRAEAGVCEKGPELVDEERRNLARAEEDLARPLPPPLPGSALHQSVDALFVQMWERVLPHTGGDRSRADFRAAALLLGLGISEDQVGAAMLEHSPDLASRKGRWAEDYVRKTVRSAAKSELAGRLGERADRRSAPPPERRGS